MSPLRRLQWLFAAAACLPAWTAAADPPSTDEDEAAAREAEIFAEPADEGEREGEGEGEDAAAREADMFGESAESDAPEESDAPAQSPPDATGESAESREGELFGAEAAGSQGLVDRIGAGLEELMVSTELGGQVYLRLDWASAPLRFSVDQLGEHTEDESLSSPSLFDLFLDARPIERVRAYASVRYRNDFAVRDTSRVALRGTPVSRDGIMLNQLWLKFDIEQFAYLTVGMQPIRWGSSRFWNPTDFMNSQRRDPLAVFDERGGITLVKLHVPVPALGWNLYVLANLDGAVRPEETGVGWRAEGVFGETEVALSGAWRYHNPLKLGLDVSTGLWLFDVRAEVALSYDDATPFWAADPIIAVGQLNEENAGVIFQLFNDGRPFYFNDDVVYAPRQRSRADQWILQGVLGADIEIPYNEPGDTILIGAEYFYNDYGYKSDVLYPWLAAVGQLDPLYVGRHYLGVYATLIHPFEWDDTTFIVSGLGNLSDMSFLARFDYRVAFLRRLLFLAYVQGHFGEQGGSFTFGTPGVPFRAIENEARRRLGDDDVDHALLTAGITDQNKVGIERGQPFPEVELGIGLRLQF